MFRIPLGLFIIYAAGNMADDVSLFTMAITGILGLIIAISGYIPAKRMATRLKR